MNIANAKYPGGSKKRVNRAGDAVRNNAASAEDLAVIEEWRAAHRVVLNTWQALLRTRARGRDVSVAQRHKRKNTIYGKLNRFKKMKLARMDDIAGCRLIFRSLEDLQNFRDSIHKARFDHKLRNEPNQYNYIETPKNTGYRGIHDVYEYQVRSAAGASLKGLYIEIQYRTAVQHAWATAVEVIGFITESQPKFQEGDPKYQKAMAIASELLARAHEKQLGPLPNIPDETLVREFLAIDKRLGLLNMLRQLNSAEGVVSRGKNTILIFQESGQLTMKSYRDATDALRALFELEQEQPELDVVLVKADSDEEMRYAFKNYFSDAQDFVQLIDSACERLSGKKAFRTRKKQPPLARLTSNTKKASRTRR